VLRKFLTFFSNIEKTNLTLNKDIRENISGKKNLIFSSIIDNYRQYALLQIMKIGVNIEILGSPVNFVKGLGTGVKDFFQKPAEGIINGPLEGIKGVYSGTKSLVKNTLGGTLNSVSKITNGFSKEILMISQDEKYINERERKNMMDKPKNLVEGIGYGLSSMMSGIFYGVTDVVRKPLEGAKKDNLKGFGKGVLQGLGGLVAKPVSGVVDLISKTTDGIKNTLGYENDQVLQQRFPRPFYGKFKTIRDYNRNDAEVIYAINKIIPCFQKNIFNDFIGSLIYQSEKGDLNLLVFGVNEFYLIEGSRFELILKLKYENIKTVYSDENFVVRIEFNKKINKKLKASIKINKQQKQTVSQQIINLFKESLNVEN
jgi:vacuolar protein sorting-associated protein 13A/C